MFKEYTSWKSKLEQIELKMKSEVDYWRLVRDFRRRMRSYKKRQ